MRERQPVAEHFVQHHAETVQVGAEVDGAIDAASLLGRDVRNCPLQRAGALGATRRLARDEQRQSKIDQVYLLRRVHNHIGRVQILQQQKSEKDKTRSQSTANLVNDVALVNGLQWCQRLDGDVEAVFERRRAAREPAPHRF